MEKRRSMEERHSMEEIIIWGAGKAAVKRYEWAVFAGFQVSLFVDNDATKWGTTIKEIPVCSPGKLKGCQLTVVLPELYQDEMAAQLEELGFQGRKIGFDQFKKEAVCRKEILIDFSGARIGKETIFVFDSYFTGLNWGGVESWSCTVANQLLKSGAETWVICGANQKFDECISACLHFTDENELETIKEMAVKIAAFLPCVFVTHGSIALYAARIVKTIFPDKIKLIAVAHGDESNTYKRLKFWSDKIDKIVCISEKIHMELQDRYGLNKDLLVYRPNPIQIPAFAGRRTKHDGTLRVGFAARLRKEQKRVHLLPEIIEICMRKMENVEFDIAGEGECMELLLDFVTENHLENKVHVLGWIPPTETADFWGKEDIYLNISDFEGMSLAMLEAMACGAVPVVTNVSGVWDVIENGKNGFVVPVERWQEAAEKIECIGRNREMLLRAGEYNMKLIRERCNLVDYAKWMMDMFDF